MKFVGSKKGIILTAILDELISITAGAQNYASRRTASPELSKKI
ncbi:hypothetical protein [Psychroserpens sp.]